MQKFTSRSLLAFGALGLALLPLASTAEAAPKSKDKGKGVPPSYAPAYGRRDRGIDPSGNSGNSDYDQDDTVNYGRRGRNGGTYGGSGGGYGRGDGEVRTGNYGRIVTLEGVVTGTDGDGDFRVQAGGRSFDVNSESNTRVRVGQRVTLRGSFEGDNNFNARTVTLATRSGNGGYGNGGYGNGGYGNGGYGTDQRVNFPGVVTRVLGSGELEVRAENGRTYRVAPRNNGSEYQVGNRIRVTGTANGNRIDSARITFQNGGVAGGIFGSGGIFGGNRGDIYGNGGAGSNEPGGYYGNPSNTIGQNVNFSGRIVSLNTGRRTAVVRGDNGREYPVQGRELNDYRVGERVRVRGLSRYGTIELSDIQHVK